MADGLDVPDELSVDRPLDRGFRPHDHDGVSWRFAKLVLMGEGRHSDRANRDEAHGQGDGEAETRPRPCLATSDHMVILPGGLPEWNLGWMWRLRVTFFLRFAPWSDRLATIRHAELER